MPPIPLAAALVWALLQPASPVARIEGLIKDPAGKPVAGALVILRGSARPLTARSDGHGVFVLAVDGPGDYTLRVEKDGFAPATLEHLAAPRADVRVTLQKGLALEGVVRDARGKPVAGARVDARRRGSDREVPVLAAAPAGLARATTDARGAFRLDGLPAEPLLVTASAPRMGSARREGVRPGGKMDIVLLPGASLGGTVKGADGRPQDGASVVLESDSDFYPSRLADRTDERGAFHFGAVDPGRWRVAAWKRGLAPAVAKVSITRGDEASLALTLGAPARATGRLVDGEGRPQRGTVALQEVEGQLVLSTLGQVLRAESSTDGRFVVEGLPRARFALVASARGLAAQRVEARAAGAALDLGDVVLERGLAIAGRVTDELERPVRGARVGAWSPEARRAVAAATTEDDGTFLIAGAEPGAYQVGVRAPGYSPAAAQVAAGDPPVEVVLHPTSSIVGAVVDARGTAVPAFGVTALPGRGPGERRLALFRAPRMTEGTDGHFVLQDLEPGTWNLAVQSTDSVPAREDGVVVTAGVTTDVGVVKLVAGVSLRGRVTDSKGAPIVGASVRAQSHGWNFARGGEGGVYSDAAGAFELSGVEPGRVEVVAAHPAFATARLEGFEVPADGPSAAAHIVMTRGGSVEGTVHRRGGLSADGVSVATSPASEGNYRPVPVAADGTFHLDTVPAGRVQVILSESRGDLIGIPLDGRTVEVVEGETVAVDFALSEVLVTGSVTRGGEPGAGVRVAFEGRGSSPARRTPPLGTALAAPSRPAKGAAVASDDGTYALVVNEPGTYRVVLGTADGRGSYTSRDVEVPDAATAAFDFAVGGTHVPGIVTDADTGKPLQADVAARAVAVRPDQSARARCGPDGRFALELEPAAYLLTASVQGYRPEEVRVTVGDAPPDDVNFALGRSLHIGGRVVDATGRAVVRAMVMALPESGPPPAPGRPSSPTDEEGSFEIDGLAPGSYTLSATMSQAAPTDAQFGLLSSVAAGASDVVVQLGPLERVQVNVVGVDASQAYGVTLGALRVDGHPVTGLGGSNVGGDLRTFLSVPRGLVTIGVVDGAFEGASDVTVSAGEPATVTVTVRPR